MMHEYSIKHRMSQWESCFGTKRTESKFKRTAVACSDEDRQTLRELREMAMVTHRLSFPGSWFPKGNQSWIFIRGLKLTLKLQCFGHLMQRADSLEKTLVLGKNEGSRRRGRQRMSWLYDITNAMDTSLSKIQEMTKDREVWHTTVHGVSKTWTQLSNNNNKDFLIWAAVSQRL